MPRLEDDKTRSNHSRAYFALFLASVIYGGNTVAGRLITGSIPPLTVSAIRVVLALVVLFPVAWPMLASTPKPNHRELMNLFLLSLLGVTIPYNSLLLGLQHTTGTNASVIFATTPAVTNFMAFLIHKVRPSRRQVLGMVAAFFGLAVIFTQGRISQLFSYQLGMGEFFICINILSVCLFNTLGQRTMKKFPSVVTSVYTMLFASIVLIPLGIWQNQLVSWHLSWSGWLVVLYMGCLAAGIAYFFNLYGVDKIGSGPASIFSNLSPVFGIIFSVLILKETLAFYHLTGFLLVISGIVLSLSKGLSQKAYGVGNVSSKQSNSW